ncbi:MAG: YhjD/YihY/BrkB family envelope integrity protein [Streptosporangiaceae bacterium]
MGSVETKGGIMAEPGTERTSRRAFEKVRGRVQVIRGWAERTLLWKIWDRMLETEFIDRSIALAGKAFISFFPLIIVVAAFLPSHLRTSILTTVTHRLGITGASLATVRQAFASAQDIRRATGLLGLILAIFYASSFTTALRRAYLRAWRRPPGGKAAGNYVRGVAWVAAFLVYMGLLGGARNVLGGGAGIAPFVIVALALSTAIWWFTAWLMLKGQVRFRVLLPSGLITGIALSAYGLSATLWMPNNVTSNNHQYGIFGVALALVAWFSGAAICIVVGACAGPVLAEDPGPVGRLVRGGAASPLVEGALPPLPPPVRSLRLADAFASSDDDILPEPERPAKASPAEQNPGE